LGTTQSVASLALPSGSFTYVASVDFTNGGSTTDSVTCALIDGSGSTLTTEQASVPADDSQTISIVGASTSTAGTATVSCSDVANSTSAYVDSAAFTATLTGDLAAKAEGVLRTGSATGNVVNTGDTLSEPISLGVVSCTNPGSADETVTSNPIAPGEADLTVSSLSFGTGCTYQSHAATLTASTQYLALTDEENYISGGLQLTFRVPSLSINCVFTNVELDGQWSNATNGASLSYEFSGGTGTCPGFFESSGSMGPVTDTSVAGNPLVFLS